MNEIACKWCGEVKPHTLEFFQRSGRNAEMPIRVCRVCRSKYGRAAVQVAHAAFMQATAARHADPMKKCGRCGEIKPRATGFGVDRQRLDGLSSYCRPCKVKAAGESKKRNPERVKAEWRRHAQKSEVKARRAEQRREQRARKRSSVTPSPMLDQ